MKGVSSSLRVVLLVFLVIGAVGTASADAGVIDYTSLVYIAADNFLLLCALMSAVLAVRTRDDGEIRRSIPLVSLVGMIVSILLSAWLLSAKTPLTLYRWLLIAFIGTALGLCIHSIVISPEIQIPGAMRLRSPLIFGGLALCVVVTAILRLVAPGTAFLTWIMAPLLLCFIPGFGLTLGLLPLEVGWTEHIVYAIPLSLGVYLVSLAWLVQFSVKVTPSVFFIIALVTTAIGFGLDWFRHRLYSDKP